MENTEKRRLFEQVSETKYVEVQKEGENPLIAIEGREKDIAVEQPKRLFSIISEEKYEKIKSEDVTVKYSANVQKKQKKLFEPVENLGEASIARKEDAENRMPEFVEGISTNCKAENLIANECIHSHPQSGNEIKMDSQQLSTANQSLPYCEAVFEKQSKNGLGTIQCNTQSERRVVDTNKKKRISLSHDRVGFSFEAGKLWAIGEEGHVYLGNFYLHIKEERVCIEELVNEANEVVDEARKVVWNIMIFTNGKNYEGLVENEDLLNLTWIRRRSDNRAMYENGGEAKQLLSIYLNQLIQQEEYKCITEYSTLGLKWQEDGSAFYLTSDGVIGHPELPIRAVKGFKLLTQTVSETYTVQEYLNMRKIIGGKREMRCCCNIILWLHH